jgi:hypothetical protein
MSDEKLNQVAVGEYHSNGWLCTDRDYGCDCEYYDANDLKHLGRYHTCGSCKHFGIVGNLQIIGHGNACYHEKNKRPE